MVDTVILPSTKPQLIKQPETVLIIGYGRAGKRHAKIAKELGLEVYIYDPYVDRRLIEKNLYHTVWSDDLPGILSQNANFSYGVIAVPPDMHFAFIGLLSDYNTKILCEKPLCSLLIHDGIVLEDNPTYSTMIAYNWRYHPIIKHLQSTHQPNHKYRFEFSKHRSPIPEWGLLLDHLSHDLDIARFITGDELHVTSAYQFNTQHLESWKVHLNENQVVINDTTYKYTTYRSDVIMRYVDDVYESSYHLEPDEIMFYDMWRQFLSGDYNPDLADAIKTQELIEEVNKYATSTF